MNDTEINLTLRQALSDRLQELMDEGEIKPGESLHYTRYAEIAAEVTVEVALEYEWPLDRVARHMSGIMNAIERMATGKQRRILA